MKDLKPVVVCVAPRVVLFGYVPETGLDKVDPVLVRARMAVYWCSDVHGVLGLGVVGPLKGSRVTPAVSRLEIRSAVEAVFDCSHEALAAWEAEPWS